MTDPNEDENLSGMTNNAFYEAIHNASSDKEAFEMLAFGIEPDEAINRIASNAPEFVVRVVFAALLIDMLRLERYDMVMDVARELARLTIVLGLEDEVRDDDDE